MDARSKGVKSKKGGKRIVRVTPRAKRDVFEGDRLLALLRKRAEKAVRAHERLVERERELRWEVWGKVWDAEKGKCKEPGKRSRLMAEWREVAEAMEVARLKAEKAMEAYEEEMGPDTVPGFKPPEPDVAHVSTKGTASYGAVCVKCNASAEFRDCECGPEDEDETEEELDEETEAYVGWAERMLAKKRKA